MNPARLAYETLPLTPTINDISRFTLDLGGGGSYRLKIKKIATGYEAGSAQSLCNIQGK
jgi:hypothetical protein